MRLPVLICLVLLFRSVLVTVPAADRTISNVCTSVPLNKLYAIGMNTNYQLGNGAVYGATDQYSLVFCLSLVTFLDTSGHLGDNRWQYDR
jgi:hypothetical protein